MQEDPSRSELREVARMVHRLCDVGLDADEFAALELRLKASPAARQTYREIFRLHSNLSWTNAGGQDAVESSGDREASAEVLSPPPVAQFWDRMNRPTPFSLFTAAAVLFAGLTFLSLLRSFDVGKAAPRVPRAAAPQPHSLATLVGDLDCRWSGAQPMHLGAELKVGVYELHSGIAELALGKGVRLTLEGPARVGIDAIDRVRLHQGRLVARVAPEARGFRVSAANAEVVDLGTEFGVAVDASGALQVCVFHGMIELRPAGESQDSQPRRLVAGEMAEVPTSKPGAVPHVRSDFASVAPFVRNLPAKVRLPLVRNGSFEANRFWNPPGQAQQLGNGEIEHWQATRNVGLISLNGVRDYYDNGRLPDGLQCAFIQTRGDLQQELHHLQPGSRYRLSFCYNSRMHLYAPSEGPRIAVRIRGAKGGVDWLRAELPVPRPAGQDQPFYRFESEPLTAEDSRAVLSLALEMPDGIDRTVYFDQVQLQPVALQEAADSATKPSSANVLSQPRAAKIE